MIHNPLRLLRSSIQTSVLAYQLALIFMLVSSAASSAGQRETLSARVGDQQIVFPAGYHKLNHFPDEPISFLSMSPARFLMVAGNSTVLMQGLSPQTAVPIKQVLTPGHQDEFDNGYAGISSTYFDQKNNVLLGFYHAEDHVGMPMSAINPDVHGAYWSIGLAVCPGNNTKFTKVGQILTCSIPKKQVTRDSQGIGDVYVIADPTNSFLYAYYSDMTRRKDDPTVRIGMARCSIDDLAKPGTWTKYRNGNFNESGLGGEESAVVNPPAAFPSDVCEPQVTYVPQWKKYLMVCIVTAFHDCETQKVEKSGIYLCHSDNGIQWSEPQGLFVSMPVIYRGREYAGHPTLFLTDISSRKASGMILYAYSPHWGIKPPLEPHHLAARPITIAFDR